MRKLLAAIGFLLALGFAGEAKAVCTLPYVLRSGTIPDATQVMANFYALQSCINTSTSACSSSFPGLVPATGGVANTFLRSDCTFAPAGGGSVVSVGLGVPPASIFGVTGSPITTSGTLGLTTTGTLGGIPYFNSTSTLASTAALGTLQLIVGGGTGGPPGTIGSVGTATTVLHGNAAGLPTFGPVANADLSSGGSVLVDGVTCTLGSSCTLPSALGVVGIPFTSSGTHTIFATDEKVTVCGAGGGAGGSLIDTSSPGGGGGGGAGGVAVKWFHGLTVGATIAVTVGSVGTGGTVGTTGGATPTDGTAGTVSGVSSGTQGIASVVANAGSGGPHGVRLTNTLGGPGGTATGGDINSSGSSGDSGLSGGATAPAGFAQSIGYIAGGFSGCPFGIWGNGGRSQGAGSTAGGGGENGHPAIVVFQGG